MAKHSSVTVREDEPHVLEISRTNTIMNALKRRALAVLNDESLDAQSRAVIRYNLEKNDPWLAELVRRADAGEPVVDRSDVLHTPDTCQHAASSHVENRETSVERIEALAELICGSGAEAAGALFVLMGALQNSAHPEAVVNAVKHFAFTRCGELNLLGMVDSQISQLEGELLRPRINAHRNSHVE